MKVLGKALRLVGGLVIVAVVATYGWLYLYTADLPSIAELNQYNPSSSFEIHPEPDSTRHVIPSDQFGKYLVNALFAAEGQPESHGPIRATVASFFSGVQPNTQMYSWQLARSLVSRNSALRRQIDELRLAERIQRHFDQRQVSTIYLNRVYLGENTYGVEDASVQYFDKHAADLSLDEAALIAGLIRSPNRDIPIAHPERALQRRNWVIDQMVRQGSVSREDGELAKGAPLIAKQTADSKPTYDLNRCALKLASHPSSPNTTIRTRPGEKLKQIPVITFRVMESGEVQGAVVSRSSGIADIDNYALTQIRTFRYKARPLGCGIIESQVGVTVDFF
ncbi:MAG TPA: transglycosylase domain-containing protein [Terriglobales bacterium]|nr:transglycosylase domain-containing protein [Terriglobales bacterium]